VTRDGRASGGGATHLVQLLAFQLPGRGGTARPGPVGPRRVGGVADGRAAAGAVPDVRTAPGGRAVLVVDEKDAAVAVHPGLPI